LAHLLHETYALDFHGADQDAAPEAWHGRPFAIPRRGGGLLAALQFPATTAQARGVVVFGHPGVKAAKGYFHRNDRVPFVTQLGYHAVTFDHSGFGESDEADGLPHRDWRDVLAWTRSRWPDLALQVWGVSMGGYFLHHILADDATPRVGGAVFEHVTPNLLRYGDDPALEQRALAADVGTPAVAWFAAETHAPRLRAHEITYVSGGNDRGIPLAQAQRLARAAGPFAVHRVVDEARHLEGWKLGGNPVRHRIAATLLSA